MTGQILNQLGNLPILFVVRMDREFSNIRDLDDFDNSSADIKYSIDANSRKIEFYVPVGFVKYTSSPYNEGERYLIAFILEMFSNLIEELTRGKGLGRDRIEQIIDEIIPFGNKKMILTATGERDLTVADIDIEEPRNIPKADASFILENQVIWLNYTPSIPKKIKGDKAQIGLFNALVSLHFEQLRQKIKEYDGTKLLMFVMRRHESLIQTRSFRKINYPAKFLCYSKFYDVSQEFFDSESALNAGNLSYRVLIEFIACLMPKGNKAINDDDVDMLIAQTEKIIQYGSISDEVNYGVRSVEVGLLPSGRIGIDRSAGENAFKDFSTHVYSEEFDRYKANFDQSFWRRGKDEGRPGEANPEIERENEIFKKGWGVGIYDILPLSHALCYYIFGKSKSVEIFSESELTSLLGELTDFTEAEIIAYIRVFEFPQRPDILQAPNGYANTEIYPWRYNRRLSYLMKPLIALNVEGQRLFIISARHLWKSSENIIGAFENGILKVNNEFHGITQLIAKQNLLKGKEYRNEVYEWLVNNLSLTVIEHEVKISPRGYFKASSDVGDIDILAIDHHRRIIYSIECKNTHQAKVAYDFKMEIDTYLGIPPKGGLIAKHVNRDKWLNENKSLVLSKLRIGESYTIYSLVVSKHVLPTKFLRPIAIKLISFHELKRDGLPG